MEEADRVLSLPGPGLLLQSTRADGTVRLHNHGSDHVRPHEGSRRPTTTRTTAAWRTPPAPDPPPRRTSPTTTCRWRWPGGAVCRRVHPGRGARRRLGLGRILAPAGVHRGPADGAGPDGRERHRRARRPGTARAPGGGGAARIAGHPHRLGHRPGGADGVRPARPVRLGRPGPGDAPRAAGHRLDPWAHVPRLTGGCGGTTVHLALASLTTGPDAPSLEDAVTDVRVDDGTVEVTWAADGSAPASRSGRRRCATRAVNAAGLRTVRPPHAPGPARRCPGRCRTPRCPACCAGPGCARPGPRGWSGSPSP